MARADRLISGDKCSMKGRRAFTAPPVESRDKASARPSEGHAQRGSVPPDLPLVEGPAHFVELLLRDLAAGVTAPQDLQRTLAGGPNAHRMRPTARR